ncbi:MAG: anthrone oxygenase family protein [Cyanobacteria bacterium J06627_8]
MIIIEHLRLPLVLLTAIGCALTAGIFFAFSTFVMQALALQPASPGIAVMQSINITVINPWFMAVFFGPGIAGAILTVFALRHWDQPGMAYWVAGSLLYIIGTLGVTIVGNIPLNDALAIVSPNSVEGTTLWTTYLTDWTLWNHIRTGAAAVSAALFTLSLCTQSSLPT